MKRRMFFAGVAAVFAAPKTLGLPRATAVNPYAGISTLCTNASGWTGSNPITFAQTLMNMRTMIEHYSNDPIRPTAPRLVSPAHYEWLRRRGMA